MDDHDSQGPEAAPAAKSEGCQPNHFGLGLRSGLDYGLGRMLLFVVHYFLRISSLSPSPMTKWTEWMIETRT